MPSLFDQRSPSFALVLLASPAHTRFVLKGTALEIVLINRDPKKAEGEASDLQHAVPLGQPVKVTAGNYKDAADCAIVIFAARAPLYGWGGPQALRRAPGLVGKCVHHGVERLSKQSRALRHRHRGYGM